MKARIALFALVCICLLTSCKTVNNTLYGQPLELSQAVLKLEIGMKKKEVLHRISNTGELISIKKDKSGDIKEAIRFDLNNTEYYRLEFLNERLVGIEKLYIPYHERAKELFQSQPNTIEQQVETQP